MKKLFIPCCCINDDHGLLLTIYDDEGEVGLCILKRMNSNDNSFINRVVMAWRTLLGIQYDDFILLSKDQFKEIDNFIEENL